mgnify:CR=1 FL=1
MTQTLEKYRDKDLDSKLESSKEWVRLTELQKKIAYLHWVKPELTKTQIASELSCGIVTIYNFFNTPVYAYLALEIDRLDFKELRQLAVKAFREALGSQDGRVKLAAAIKLLESEGLLHEPPPLEKDREFKVVWGNAPDLKEKTDERTDTLQPASGPAGSP